MTTTPTLDYLDKCREITYVVEAQTALIREVADLFTSTILTGRMVHVFGSGHARSVVEETWPHHGSFPGFNPIFEPALSPHSPGVGGASGQRQARFLENVPGLAARILRNFRLSDADNALVISSSGCNVVGTEIAEEFQSRGVRVVAIVSLSHSQASKSRRADGKKLPDFADLVLDTGAPVGDAMVHVRGLDAPVASGATVGGCLLVNSLKAEIALRLTAAHRPPRVLCAEAIVGAKQAAALFESACDEHARRLSGLYADLWA